MKKTTDKKENNDKPDFKELLKSLKREAVNHPAHYQTGNGIEVIDVIEAFGLGFNLGNVVKYVLRAGKKDEVIQELSKAKWYLEREIGNLKAKAEYEAGAGARNK